jgi:hypothetical protein
MNQQLVCVYGLLIVGLIILLAKPQKSEYFTGLKTVSSFVDGKPYQVVNLFDDAQEAADMLAMLNSFLVDVMRFMKQKYIINGHPGKKAQRLTQTLLYRYNPDVIFENNPTSKHNTSYVTNKGEDMALCLREKKTGNNNFHDESILKFVALHELSHIITEDFGHGDNFWTNFKFILSQAVEANLYAPINYELTPVKYCRLLVYYSPLYDDSLVNIASLP